MAFDLTIHHRCSIRLRHYDYAQTGFYFLTICTFHRRPLFGEVVDGVMILNAAGLIADAQWQATREMRANVALHECVIMPNHMHGILEITASDELARDATLGDMVRGYKSAVTKQVRAVQEVAQLSVWQRGFYENVIRSEDAYVAMSDYIQTNPQRWKTDIYFAK
jgi:putative transposase